MASVAQVVARVCTIPLQIIEMMKIAIIQNCIRTKQLEWTLQSAADLLDQQPGADLYVLPETFATGFMAEGSIEQGSQVLSWMQQQASRLDAAVAGSVAIIDRKQQLRNRFYFVRPNGRYAFYDKHHLFTMAGENSQFVPGERRVVVEWRGVRFLLQVCYDLRFPVFSRNQGDYDAIIYVANWPSSRAEVWHTLLRARALENQCYVIGVNITGDETGVAHAGDSAIIDAYGHTLAQCPPDKAASASALLDMETLQRFRQKFPVLADADPLPPLF